MNCGCGGTGRRAGLRNQCQRRGGSSPFIRTRVRKREFLQLSFLMQFNAILMQQIYAKIAVLVRLNIFAAPTKRYKCLRGATKSIKDYKLTHYACYLIAKNRDPRKEVIALA